MQTEQLLISLIILPPLIGALLVWIGNNYWKMFGAVLGITTIGISAIASLVALTMEIGGNWSTDGITLNSWIGSDYNLGIIFNPDALSIMMAVVASFLGLLIAIFSIEYMSGDEHLSRYWFYLQVFISGMTILVLASDLIAMYIGWEMVGLCSFGLISHWYTKKDDTGRKAGLAGIKAFVFTRIGDIGFLVAIVILYQEIGSVSFSAIIANVDTLDEATLTVVGIMFLAAAFGKAAQFPFIPWLSSPEHVDIDAMQGPTTVSALIHAATMVKAGVYLISRAYLTIPFWESMTFVWTLIVLSGITAFIAAMSALTSWDLKRILAFSTVSQLAYMFLSLGFAYLGMNENHEEMAAQAFLAAQAHLVSHALFKSLLFLTAGYLIHEVGSRNIKDMQGKASWNTDRIAFAGIFVGGLALIGFPPLNGFFSKDAIIGTSFLFAIDEVNLNLSLVGYVFAVLTALVTAMYVGRLFYYVIRPVSIDVSEEHETHQQPRFMPGVIVILVTLTVIGGVFVELLPQYLETVIVGEIPFPHGLELLHMVVLVLLIVGMTYLSYTINARKDLKQRITSTRVSRAIIHASSHGFYLEDVWMGGWNLLKNGSYGLRRSHSGKLNDMMMYATLIAVAVILIMVGDLL